MAPGFGEDDQLACNAAGIPTVLTVDDRRRFTTVVPDFEGLQVFDANRRITASCASRAAWCAREIVRALLPALLACRNPLIYKAVSSWFVEVTQFSDRMVELNQEITWVPEHVKDGQFGKWLENARDWSISRNRFWGSPIPVWKSDDPNYPRIDVYGIAGRARARLRRPAGRPAPARHRRPDPAQPGRPDGHARPCAGCPRCWTAGSSPARCRSPRCTTRSRTRTGSTAISRATSSSSTSARPGAGSTRCTCWPPRCSTGPRSELRQPRHPARQRRPEDVQAPAQLPGRERGVRHLRLGRHALVPDGQPDPARRQPGRRRAEHQGRRAPGAPAAVERATTSSPCTPTPSPTRPARRPRSEHVLDRYVLAKTRGSWRG